MRDKRRIRQRKRAQKQREMYSKPFIENESVERKRNKNQLRPKSRPHYS